MIDFNPYTYKAAGKQPMSFEECSRHIIQICNELNQGKQVTSRHVAFIFGLSVNSFLDIENKKKSVRIHAFKQLGRVKLYDKQSVLNFFECYKPQPARIHTYIKARVGSKKAVELYQLALNNLS